MDNINNYREYMKRYFYSMDEDAAPSTTTANVATYPVIINTTKRKKFKDYLLESYDEYKNISV